MKPYFTLFWKEVKSISGVTFLIMVALLCAISLRILDILNLLSTFDEVFLEHVLTADKTLMDSFIYSTLFMVPVLLAYSLNCERKSKTNYLLLSLPVSKFHTMLIKFIVVTILSVILSFLIAFFSNVKPWLPTYFSASLPNIHINIFTISLLPYLIDNFDKHINFETSFIFNFGFIFVHTSLVCVAQSVMLAFKRYRIFVWTITYIAGLSFFEYTYSSLKIVFSSVKPMFLFNRPIYMSFPFFAGFLFLITGLVLYEKYGDV